MLCVLGLKMRRFCKAVLYLEDDACLRSLTEEGLRFDSLPFDVFLRFAMLSQADVFFRRGMYVVPLDKMKAWNTKFKYGDPAGSGLPGELR